MQAMTQDETAQEWLTMEQAADRAGVNYWTMRRYVAEGKIQGYTRGAGRRVFIRRDDLDAFLGYRPLDTPPADQPPQ